MTRALTRRQLIAAGAATASLPFLNLRASAQSAWPSKQIRVICGYPVGGQTDLISRIYSDNLSKQFGQAVIVENKAGGGGTVGALELKRSAPDGYTLMCTISTTLIQNRVTIKDLPYDTDKDFIMFSFTRGGGLPMLANEKTGAKNLKEFVEYVKRNGGKGSIGTYALGSFPHMVTVGLNKQFGLNLEPVHYRGEAPMWADVAGQSIDAAIGSYNASLPIMQSGKGRAIGIVGRRIAALPDVGTLREQGAESKLFDLRGFTGWLAPVGTPADIVRKLSDAMVVAGQDAKVQQALASFLVEPAVDADTAQREYKEEAPLILSMLNELGVKPE